MSMVAPGLDLHLLVFDHLMPGMTGVQLVEAVRMYRPSLKALIVSGYAKAEEIDPTLPRLTEPFRRDESAATLAALTSTQPINRVGGISGADLETEIVRFCASGHRTMSVGKLRHDERMTGFGLPAEAPE
ncbi:hypothetical protein ABC347_08710 [Sphingomonas sp. 1P06PA]|uniref:hypothetical protein n=1 Tax=Sphingomonas sp. 1P06PA TaxID=554121 RepID=UPI0039A6BCDE